MRIRLNFLVIAAALCTLSAQAQDPAGQPSAQVQPALDRLAAAGSGIDLNKWKGGNQLRGDVDANLLSIQKDLHDTLPPLLLVSDKSPASVAASLPILLNLDALYSVVLRVDIAAKGNAPREEVDALDGALNALDGARRDLGDRIVVASAAMEKQVTAMQATVQQQGAQIAALQASAAAPAPVKTKKRAVRKKSASAPAASH